MDSEDGSFGKPGLPSLFPVKGALTHHPQAGGGIPPVGRDRALSEGAMRVLRNPRAAERKRNVLRPRTFLFRPAAYAFDCAQSKAWVRELGYDEAENGGIKERRNTVVWQSII